MHIRSLPNYTRTYICVCVCVCVYQTPLHLQTIQSIETICYNNFVSLWDTFVSKDLVEIIFKHSQTHLSNIHKINNR